MKKLLRGYKRFRKKYVLGQRAVMRTLSTDGQKPEIMVIACCDSRVDPALILQCDPGDLFVVRNVANIVPPFEKDEGHHGTSAALEFAVRFLKVKHIILLGHSQCGGIQTLLHQGVAVENDFISNWVCLMEGQGDRTTTDADTYARQALHRSHKNCLSFPWISEAVNQGALSLHRWFFDIRHGQVLAYEDKLCDYIPLENAHI